MADRTRPARRKKFWTLGSGANTHIELYMNNGPTCCACVGMFLIHFPSFVNEPIKCIFSQIEVFMNTDYFSWVLTVSLFELQVGFMKYISTGFERSRLAHCPIDPAVLIKFIPSSVAKAFTAAGAMKYSVLACLVSGLLVSYISEIIWWFCKKGGLYMYVPLCTYDRLWLVCFHQKWEIVFETQI